MPSTRNVLPPAVAEQGDVMYYQLQAAIAHGYVQPAFQPIVSMRDSTIAGFEVLARWHDPSKGDISPSEFIPLFEQYDLIDCLSDALMVQACSVAATWKPPFFLAFNISPNQLLRENLPKRIAAIAVQAGFPLNRLQVEITESALLADNEMARRLLQELNLLSVKVGIDDFGTEHSNFARLESLRFDKLKIDARFVRSLDSDVGKRRIVAAIIGLGQSLGLAVVAEGVETIQEETILRAYGCDLGQGWLYGKGVPAEEAGLLVQKNGGQFEFTQTLDVSPFQQLLQLSSLYQQAPVGLCFVDLGYRHVRANERFAAIHGMTAAELEGKSLYDVMSEEQADNAKRFLLSSMESHTAIPNLYCAHDRKYLFFSSRVVDIDHAVIGFSVVSIDISMQNSAGCFGPQEFGKCPWMEINPNSLQD